MSEIESWALNSGRRRNMQANRNRDTKPELRLRRLLHAQGFRYRVCHKPLPGSRLTADIVFTRSKVVVFLDGCFWHGCPEHFKLPKRNADYWRSKIGRNRNRDALFDQQLATEGWTVVRAWEHEDLESVGDKVRIAVRSAQEDLALRFRRSH